MSLGQGDSAKGSTPGRWTQVQDGRVPTWRREGAEGGLVRDGFDRPRKTRACEGLSVSRESGGQFIVSRLKGGGAGESTAFPLPRGLQELSRE